MAKYSDYDDLIRDLDHEGLSDDPFGGVAFEDDDLALLNQYSPDAPARKRPAKAPPKRKPAKKPKT